ncbi:MAG: 23S rRNA (adenine(2030)-N(6))-methyltransferase RlmJ [Legionellales bacterium]
MDIQKILITEILIHHELLPDRLNGCGMVIINAPWQLDMELETALPQLLPYLMQNLRPLLVGVAALMGILMPGSENYLPG